MARFVRTLGSALPPGTVIALRGSAVAGTSFNTGEPFDAQGPHTSDLDIVLIGDPVMSFWVPEAKLLGRHQHPAAVRQGRLGGPRPRPRSPSCAGDRRRPVSLQAMARWFLELRANAQGQPYIVLSEGS